MSIMNDEEVKVDFEATIMQLAASSTMVRAIPKTHVTEKAIAAPVVMLVAHQSQKEVSKAAYKSIVSATPSPPPSHDRSSSPDDDWKERKQKKHSRQKKESSSSRSEDRGA